MAFNKVILVGNLVVDPELKATPSGVSVATFRMAVERRHKAEGQPDADFISVVAWRNTAEFVSKYFTKGKGILVCGQLQTRQYTDKDGVKRTLTEVVADEVSFVGKSEGTTQSASQKQSVPVKENFAQESIDDDLPF